MSRGVFGTARTQRATKHKIRDLLTSLEYAPDRNVQASQQGESLGEEEVHVVQHVERREGRRQGNRSRLCRLEGDLRCSVNESDSNCQY